MPQALRRTLAGVVLLATGAGLAGVGLATGAGEIRNGGTFRIGHPYESPAIDPALLGPVAEEGEIPSITCLYPLNYADEPRVRVIPEAAARFPTVSSDGRTYTFRIRRGLRFNTGERVTAQTFVASVNRALRLRQFAGAIVGDIAGAEDVREGRATSASGLRARGAYTLVITLERPAPEFMFRTISYAFCAVPRGLPEDPEGARPPIASAGPYYVASVVRGRRVVLRRNRFYRGPRKPRVDGFVISYGLEPRSILTRIERRTLDTGDLPPDAHGRLARRYGVNRSRFFVKATPLIYHARLNADRPLFRDARMRRAANFAVDRRALVAAGSRARGNERFGAYWGTAVDQWLVPRQRGYRPAQIYPLRGSLAKARALFRGYRGRRAAVIYTASEEPYESWAQSIGQRLTRVGVRVSIRSFPRRVLFEKLLTRGEPWDLALAGAYGPSYPDPQDTFVVFEGPPTPPKYRRALRGASRLTGRARYRAYGKLDVDLARDVAPTIPFAAWNLRTFVSRRVGCKIFRPELDLAAVCLNR